MSNCTTLPLAKTALLRERQVKFRLAINDGGSVNEPVNPVSRTASTSCSCLAESWTGTLITISKRVFTETVIIRGLRVQTARRFGKRLADRHELTRSGHPSAGSTNVPWL